MNRFKKIWKTTSNLKETTSVVVPVSMVVDDGVSMVVDNEYRKDVDKSRRYLRVLLHEHNCAVDTIKLAWSEAMTFDVISKIGGPNGSIRKTRKTTTDLKETTLVVVSISMVVDDEYRKDVDKFR
ncbi:hypothetical protein QYF36_015870 [Acer negundo]|nr:hypothetical protein QYF36_015870 [Acer negundo]